jgi:hypothetical protein
MSHQAFFAGLIYDENDRPVATKLIGQEAHYVIDDAGFLRHIPAEDVDRQVLGVFLEQLQDNKDLAIGQALRMMGKDDLLTKAALDASLRNVDVDEILRQGLPGQARDMLGMMGFRIVINFHGDLLRLDQPGLPDEGFE